MRVVFNTPVVTSKTSATVRSVTYYPAKLDTPLVIELAVTSNTGDEPRVEYPLISVSARVALDAALSTILAEMQGRDLPGGVVEAVRVDAAIEEPVVEGVVE